MKHLEQMQLKDSLSYVFTVPWGSPSCTLDGDDLLMLLLLFWGTQMPMMMHGSFITPAFPHTHRLFLKSSFSSSFPSPPPLSPGLGSMYNGLVARCFDGCVSSFRSKTLDKTEIGCMVRNETFWAEGRQAVRFWCFCMWPSHHEKGQRPRVMVVPRPPVVRCLGIRFSLAPPPHTHLTPFPFSSVDFCAVPSPRPRFRYTPQNKTGKLFQPVHQNDATGRPALCRTPGYAAASGGQCRRSRGKVGGCFGERWRHTARTGTQTVILSYRQIAPYRNNAHGPNGRGGCRLNKVGRILCGWC